MEEESVEPDVEDVSDDRRPGGTAAGLKALPGPLLAAPFDDGGLTDEALMSRSHKSRST